MRKKGFTLAEVLITLAVIGVVASIIVPAMMNNVNDAELRTAWKKIYGTLDQATRQIMLDNGGTMDGICPNNDSCMAINYKAYLNRIKLCSDSSAYGCWHTANNWYHYNGSVGTYITNSASNITAAGLLLNDGTMMFFYMGNSCSNSDPVNDPIITSYCGYITVDVNGSRNPNTVGRDIFAAWITRNGLKPVGGTTSSIGYDKSSLYLRQ